MAKEDRSDNAITVAPAGKTPKMTTADDYQTKLYQSLADLGASNPEAMLIAAGDFPKRCRELTIAPQVTAALIYGAERHRHEVTRTTINEAREG